MLTCKYEDGHQAFLRHVTVDALIIKDKQILLVRRNPDYYIEGGKFALPGGFLERDESADEGVKREVLEETGYQSTQAELFRIIHRPRLKGDDRQNVGFFFLVTITRQIGTPDHEIASLHWFELNHLPEAQTLAFDHKDTINLFRQHQKHPYRLPIINDSFKT